MATQREAQKRQQVVLDLLSDFSGMEPLKKLLSELNYGRISDMLSMRGWGQAAKDALAEPPLLLAGGGEDNEFHVIYNRLASDRLRLGDERPVVNHLLRDHPYALFVFSTEAQDRWHFLNVKYDDEASRRRIFRRITVGREERLRTASERIAMLDPTTIGPDLFGLSPLAIQKRHDEAFDVEAVSDEFFREYARVFESVEADVRGIRDKDRRRLFTQRLFNRLMFIGFVQKKGWLKFGEKPGDVTQVSPDADSSARWS